MREDFQGRFLVSQLSPDCGPSLDYGNQSPSSRAWSLSCSFSFTQKKKCHHRCDWVFVTSYHEGNRFKWSISKYLSMWKHFFPHMWKMWELLTFSQVMSLISYREWTTITKRFFITIRKNKTKTTSSTRKWNVRLALQHAKFKWTVILPPAFLMHDCTWEFSCGHVTLGHHFH